MERDIRNAYPYRVIGKPYRFTVYEKLDGTYMALGIMDGQDFETGHKRSEREVLDVMLEYVQSIWHETTIKDFHRD